MPGSIDRGKLAEALGMVTILRQSYIDHGLWGDLIPILDAARAVLEATKGRVQTTGMNQMIGHGAAGPWAWIEVHGIYEIGEQYALVPLAEEE